MRNNPIIFRQLKMSANSLNDAVRKHDIEKVRYILKQGVPVDIEYTDVCAGDIYYFTALEVAAGSGDLEMVRFLLQAGANPNFKNGNGKTALMAAVEEDPCGMCNSSIPYVKSYPEVVQLLIQSGAGASINTQNCYGYAALESAAGSKTQRSLLNTQILIQAGANVNLRGRGGWTALMSAAKYSKNLEIVRVLLHAGANADLRDENGKTAYDFGNDAIKNLISKYPIVKENIKILDDLRSDQSTYFSRIPKDLTGLIKNVFENEI